jgi:hypothetical protein
MTHIRVRVLGALIALVAFGAFVAAPSIATAEEPATAEPAVEASPLITGEEVCGPNICVWAHGGFEPRESPGFTSCEASGVHVLGFIKESIVNGCGNVAVWTRDNGITRECKNPGTSDNYPTYVFNELLVGGPGSRCS